MKPYLLLAWLCLLLLPAASPAGADSSAAVMTVTTRHAPPFSIRDKEGTWHGISIGLWRTIAETLGIQYRVQEIPSLKAMLETVARSDADAAVAALTITSERETRMDFTHPFVTTGLGIAVPSDAAGGWLGITKRVVAPEFLKVMAGLLGLLLLVGLLIWVFERRRNAQFGGSPVNGIGSGLWWSAVTMTTVGYGDKSPVTPGGRALAIVWMFTSVIIISSFTAAIATALTVGQLTGKVQNKDDLARARIVTVVDSTSAQYLEGAHIGFRSEPDLGSALDVLFQGEADAVVYDAPLLRYLVRQQYDDRLHVLPGSFERQDYGIALPPGSPHREAINRVLLEILQDPVWEKLLYRYLGKTE